MTKETYTGFLRSFQYKYTTLSSSKDCKKIYDKKITNTSWKRFEKIMYRLTQINEKNFTRKLDEWYEIYKDFIEEKSTNLDTRKSYYTH